MYTVKELIEALKQCPEDYQVVIFANDEVRSIESVAMDHYIEEVALFGVHTDGE
jgi:hypothetical protein